MGAAMPSNRQSSESRKYVSLHRYLRRHLNGGKIQSKMKHLYIGTMHEYWVNLYGVYIWSMYSKVRHLNCASDHTT